MLQLLDLHIHDNSQLVLGAAACLAAVVVIVGAYLTKSYNSLPLPPSPPSQWRLRGHLLPHPNPFLTVAGWINEYGPLITIRSGIEKIVIIGRHKAAVDIMERQGALLADRPRMVLFGEIFDGNLDIFFARGKRYRQMRRAFHTHFQPTAAKEYQPLQMFYANKMILNILDDPSNFRNHIVTYTTSSIMQMAYGKNTPTAATDPEVIEILQIVGVGLTAISSGPYLVEWIPWLKYLPWYCQEFKRACERKKQLNNDHMNHVRQQIENHVDVGPSFAKYILQNGHLYDLTEVDMAGMAGSIFGAGSTPMPKGLSTVLMAAACFPEEQTKVQAELDEVIGRNKAPTFADQESLPRLQAFVLEALRWRPVIPNGFAHWTTDDVIWENYRIPAGTRVIGNHWAISRDPDVFPEPDEFRPQRWIDDKGGFRDGLRFFVYGFGRRVCPSQYVANGSMLIATLFALWAFQLTLDPTKPFDMNHHPQLCPILFQPRVPETELRRIIEDCAEVL